PTYATYEAVVGASGARMVTVPLRPEANFHPDLAAIAAAITPRTRAIWINSPHNPTGAVFTADEIGGIAALCRAHDLWLLSDEVYEDLAFARPHVGVWSLPGMADRTVVVSSLSKSHAIPAFLLLGALAAFGAELPEVAALGADYRRRAGLMCRLLAGAANCRVVPPEG